MEAARNPPLPFSTWEPFCWEFSSALSTLILLPGIVYCIDKFKWQWQYTFQSIIVLFLLAICYSLLHVFLMTSMRELVYWFSPSEYNFATSWATWFYELVYEIRKDVWSFFFFIICIHCYRYFVQQWLGDTLDLITEKNEEATDTLVVKKFGQVFFIERNNIEWIESAGNYINFHIEDRIYPMRSTLSAFLSDPKNTDFVRSHRSCAINERLLAQIDFLASGDGLITLSTGKQVKLSRRYKDSFNKTT